MTRWQSKQRLTDGSNSDLKQILSDLLPITTGRRLRPYILVTNEYDGGAPVRSPASVRTSMQVDNCYLDITVNPLSGQ